MEGLITGIVSFIAFLLHAITGFGGNILLFPVLSTLYGINTARTSMNLIAWVSSISVTVDCHKDINFKEFLYIMRWMLLGLVVGYLLIPYIKSEQIVLLIYGVIIISIALYKMVVKNQVEFSKSILIAILILAGIIQAIFVSGGAFLVIYCAQRLKNKNEFRATFTAIWLSIYTVTFFVNLFVRGYTSKEIQIFIIGALPVILASIVGSKVVNRINQKLFMKIVYSFIMVVGGMLVLNNV